MYQFDQVHTSCVFCVKCLVDDPNLIIIGGWDCTIQIWDMREQASVRSILGPHICGDSIDINGSKILAGSWREKHSLQIFDLGSGSLLTDLTIEHSPWIYSAKFSEDSQYCIASGGNPNSVILFDNLNHFASISNFPQPLFCIDITKNKQKIVAGCGDGSLSIFNLG